MSDQIDEQRMRLALEQARLADALDEVPVGCVVVHEPSGAVVGAGHNRRVIDCDPTAHAEILALRQAGLTLGRWMLVDCALYVTLEPCAMCAGAMINARIPRVVYGCDDPKAGAIRSLYRLCDDARLNHQVHVLGGVLAEECSSLLKAFFQRQRQAGKK